MLIAECGCQVLVAFIVGQKAFAPLKTRSDVDEKCVAHFLNTQLMEKRV